MQSSGEQQFLKQIKSKNVNPLFSDDAALTLKKIMFSVTACSNCLSQGNM